jgi:hypothetical protein
VLALTLASGGAWWTGERGVLRSTEALLVGRTLGAWAESLPWLLVPGWIAAGGDRRVAWLAPLVLLPPDVPGWVLGGVAVALGAARAPGRWMAPAALLQLALGAGGLAVRARTVRAENAAVAEVVAALGPDDGVVAPWTWGARVAVAAAGHPYGVRWRPPRGFLRDQRAAWCGEPLARVAVLPPAPDGSIAWVDGARMVGGCGVTPARSSDRSPRSAAP